MGAGVFAFLPSAIYFVMAPLSVSLALWLGFAAAFALTLTHFGHTGMVRSFDAAGFVLFGVMALYAAFFAPGAAASEISILLEPVFLAVILWSMSVNRPFTAAYSWLKRKHDPDVIIKAHTLLTSVWATTFALLTGIDCMTEVAHILPPGWASVLDVAVFAAMLTFTWRFGLYIDSRRGHVMLIKRWYSPWRLW
jgi:hypothetical protein